MNIAIQGHPTRGKEIIQIFKDLGTEGLTDHTGSFIDRVYLRDDSLYPNQLIVGTNITFLKEYGYKVYTLEEFEKEFPFKVGDKVITTDGTIGIIETFTPEDYTSYCIKTTAGSFYWCATSILKPYIEMKEERNITLTLDKAKEWYNKGGELKEVALQAYSEEELIKIELPKTWEEFCENYPKTGKESYIGIHSAVHQFTGTNHDRDNYSDKNICPSKESAETHLAMIQLEQLRNCWWNGWEPNWDAYEKYVIKWRGDNLTVLTAIHIHAFLVFPTNEMAEEFLDCFKDLIEKAGDLI